jgi:nucleoside-diphosphate-sugar epimerase
MTGTLLSLGHGYVAAALARRLLPRGWRVIGTTRSADKAARLAADGVEARTWPGADLAPDLAAATHILASAAPEAYGDDPFLPLLRTAQAAPRWVGYLSTTGVYGDHAGGWVDEDTPLAPSTERGRRRVAAERHWQSLCAARGWPLHIFRLAGIYGPGRSPLDRVRDGTARRIVKPGQVFSRIHVDDIALALDASMAAPRAGDVYNLCDDEPAPPQDVLAHAAALLGLPPPPEVPFDEAGLSAMARSFYAESKRVRNDRATRELGIALRYPTYREGLAALLQQDGGGGTRAP